MKRWKAAVMAGTAGGAAEILWIASIAPASAADVAREVTATFYPGLPAAALTGVAIHMLLSVALGLVLAKVLLRVARAGLVVAALGALAGVWALNFLIVLPLINPAFVTLLPFAVTLASKLLFGAAFGWTLRLSG
jgi:hypothetical protein